MTKIPTLSLVKLKTEGDSIMPDYLNTTIITEKKGFVNIKRKPSVLTKIKNLKVTPSKFPSIKLEK
jgi:hypothetical protein